MNETGKDGKVRSSDSPDAQGVGQKAQDDARHDNAAEDQIGRTAYIEDLVVFAPDEPGSLDLPPQVVVVSNPAGSKFCCRVERSIWGKRS